MMSDATLPVPELEGAGFKITGGKGFHITFANGWTVSVQFGHYNYCEHYVGWGGGLDQMDVPITDDDKVAEAGASDAEVAMWDPDGEWVRKGEYGQVWPSVTPDELALLIDVLSNMEPGDTASDLKILHGSDGIVAVERRSDTPTEGEV